MDCWKCKKVRFVFNMDSFWFWNSFSSKTTDLISSFKVSIKNFWPFLEYSIKERSFFSVRWILVGPEKPVSAISLEMPRCSYSHFFFPNSFNSPSRSQSKTSYSIQTTLFQFSWQLFSGLEMESWLAKNSESDTISDISRYSNFYLSRTTTLKSSVNVWIDIINFLNWSFSEQSSFLLLLENW